MNKSEFRTLAFRVVPIGDETEFTGRTNLHAMNSDGRLEPAAGHYKSGDESINPTKRRIRKNLWLLQRFHASDLNLQLKTLSSPKNITKDASKFMILICNVLTVCTIY